MSAEYVHQLLMLAGAPKAVRDMVQTGEATAAVALDAMRTHGGDAPEVLSAALKDAKATGKTKLTAKFLPQQIHKKACVKAAPTMFSVIEKVKADEAFATLSDELKALIDEVLAMVPSGAGEHIKALAIKSPATVQQAAIKPRWKKA